MKFKEVAACNGFPCDDVDVGRYMVPDVEVDAENISIFMISEAAPGEPSDYFYAGPGALFGQTTAQAFRDAGAAVSTIAGVLGLGVYLTTAVKCGKTGYGLKTGTIKQCSLLLEKEMDLFPNVKAYMLMGDVAIKAVNEIARRNGESRVIPAGPTYKIRGQKYTFRGRRAFPSYLQAGPSFFIEKSKRRMIAEDIRAALSISASK